MVAVLGDGCTQGRSHQFIVFGLGKFLSFIHQQEQRTAGAKLGNQIVNAQRKLGGLFFLVAEIDFQLPLEFTCSPLWL